MDKFIFRAITFSTIIFLLSAAFGIPYNRHSKSADMPEEIGWQIIVNKNIWPDQFYASSYSPSLSRSLHLDSYWTFEHGMHPVAGPVWVYHTNALDMTDVDIVANQITR